MARTARIAIWNGWQPGEGRRGMHHALVRCADFDERAPAVCVELEPMLADLEGEVPPSRFDYALPAALSTLEL